MSYFKQSIKIISLFMLMFAVVISPFCFMEYNNRKLMNELNLYAVEDAAMSSSFNDSSNIWYRLRLIKNSAAVTRSYEHYNDEMHKQLTARLKDQLELLQSHNALPKLSFADFKPVSFLRKTYIAGEAGTEYVINVWFIHAAYPDFDLAVYMDEETSAIYDITITLGGELDVYDYVISAVGFTEYLKLFSEKTDVYGEEFAGICDYGNKEISMFVMSKNLNTEKVTSYRFNKALTEAQNISISE